jgi:hypothetical protein
MAVDGNRVDPLSGSSASATIYTVRRKSSVCSAMSLPSTSPGQERTPLVLYAELHRRIHWGLWVSVEHGLSMALQVSLIIRDALVRSEMAGATSF